MTASITRSSASGPERAVRFVVGALFALCALLAQAESAIRSAEIVPLPAGGTEVRFRTGAGIVADSIPERELDETRAKARGVLKALAPV